MKFNPECIEGLLLRLEWNLALLRSENLTTATYREGCNRSVNRGGTLSVPNCPNQWNLWFRRS